MRAEPMYAAYYCSALSDGHDLIGLYDDLHQGKVACVRVAVKFKSVKIEAMDFHWREFTVETSDLTYAIARVCKGNTAFDFVVQRIDPVV